MHKFPLNTLIATGSDDFIEIHQIVDENAALISELSLPAVIKVFKGNLCIVFSFFQAA